MSAKEVPNKPNDNELSCTGIDFLINNDWESSEKLFRQYKDQSPLMHYCHSFVSFLRAIMTFEEQLLIQAQKDLENTEKMCTESSKVFSSLKKAFGLSSSSSTSSQLNKQAIASTTTTTTTTTNSNNNGNEVDASSSSLGSIHRGIASSQALEDKYTKAIILADCKLYLALLTFIRQEVSGYLTSGILQIRRSWKLYAKVQKQLYEMYKKVEPNAESIYGSDPDSTQIQLFIDESNDADEKTSQQATSTAADDGVSPSSQLGELTITDDDLGASMSPDVIKRLLGAVSFGYGVFQICLSFMPPNLLKLIKVFGFEGDRNVALKAINFTSNSKDMRAPFGDMVLLWYATVATPLFGLSECDLKISEEDTRAILDKNLAKYPQSSLFYYYKGRHMRSLKRIDDALACYNEAYTNSAKVREIQHISIYEIGWLHLMSLNYAKALEQFSILSKESKWSKSFNCYICAILCGSMIDGAAAADYAKQANNYVKEALKIVAAQTRKSNPIELFAIKRLEYFKKASISVKSKSVCELLVVELLFLWICMPECDESVLKQMLEICDRMLDKNLMALKCLFEGKIHMQLNNEDFGEQCFNEALARGESEKMPFGKYVMPYAYYHLGNYSMHLKQYDDAKRLLNKAKDNYKDYELENRIQTQIKSSQRRLKHFTDGPRLEAALKAKREEEEKERAQKQADLNNFYVL